MQKKLISLIGILFLIIGVSLYSYPKYQVYSQNKKVSIEVSNFINHENSDYFAILEIPKISLKRGLYQIGDNRNHIDKNITFLDLSDMPNQVLGNTIIAAHSGNTANSYFNRLNELEIGDLILMYYDGITYEYKVNNIYQEIKDGTISIKKDHSQTTITLITCIGLDKQLVVIGNLVREKNY